MSNLTLSQVTMTSIEIVDYINAHREEVATIEKPYKELRHDHFMAKVPQVLGEKAAPIFLGTDIYKNGTGGTVNRQIYRFPKREACLMAMSYSYELQAQVFDHMTAMEEALKKPLLPDFTDPAEAAMAWAEQFKAKRIAEEELAIAAPKVDFFDRVGERTNLMNATQVAQQLHMTAQKLNKLLDEFDVYNKKVVRGRVFKDWFIKQGLGEMKQTDLGFPQALFTTKGEQWIIQQFTSEGLI